jgi:hypothetical protein
MATEKKDGEFPLGYSEINETRYIGLSAEEVIWSMDRCPKCSSHLITKVFSDYTNLWSVEKAKCPSCQHRCPNERHPLQ